MFMYEMSNECYYLLQILIYFKREYFFFDKLIHLYVKKIINSLKLIIYKILIENIDIWGQTKRFSFTFFSVQLFFTNNFLLTVLIFK